MGSGSSQSRPNSSNDTHRHAEVSAERALQCEGWTVPKCVRSWSTSAMVYSDKVFVPSPGPGQVRLKVYAASLNLIDVKRTTFGRCSSFFGLVSNGKNGNSRGGGDGESSAGKSTRHSPPEFLFPYVMGVEGAGVVESVGWDTSDIEQQQKYDLQVGDRVAFFSDITLAEGGSFCQYAVAHADAVGKIPPPTAEDVIDFVEAASMPCAVGSAYVALFDKMRVSSGRSIFISGASGGVGSAAVQLAKYAGLFVLASCSTVNVPYVKELGADYVFDYTVVDVVGECLARTQGFGVDYVLEAADAALAVQHADALRFGGSICVLPGHMPVSSEVFFRRQLSVSYVCLAGLHAHALTRGNIRRMIETCMSLYQRGAFRLQLETVSLRRADTAMDVIAAGHTRGKIVLTDFHADEKSCGDNVLGTRRRKHSKKQTAVDHDNGNRN